jgi:hypothetical protein
VVIDGIRDLIHDINNAEEATQITSKLLKWSEELQVHIIIVLHQNKGDNNARGHLGAEAVNKAETVISVTKDSEDNSLFIVEPEQCREKDFESFAFRIDEKGNPFIVDDWIKETDKNGKKSLIPHQVPDDQHKKVLNDVFTNSRRPKYAELIEQIKLSFQQYGIDFKRNKSTEFCTYYLNKKWIVKNDREAGERYPTYRHAQPV